MVNMLVAANDYLFERINGTCKFTTQLKTGNDI